MTPPFELFVKNPYKGRLICFDPGQTTGWSIWDNSKLVDCGQLATYPVKDSVIKMQQWLMVKSQWADLSTDDRHLYPVYVVIEEYRVYAHKAEDHAQNDMHTSRFIGCLETLLVLMGIGYEMRGAGLAKGFATDEKLRDWNFWQVGERHARDAIRHGVYFLCHGKPQGVK